VSTREAPLNEFAMEQPIVPAELLFWRVIGCVERVFAASLLTLTVPLLFGAALIVVVLSRRPPLIAHKRVGQHGRTIWVLKLRTMWDDVSSPRWRIIERISTDNLTAFGPKSAQDPRVSSRFAVLCRRYSIDELPQLWSVVRGDMALIGPRPLTAREIQLHYTTHAIELLSKKPGITGLWQISGRSLLSYHQRRRLDLFMIRRWCFSLYLRIFLITIPSVLTGKNAW